MNADGPTPYTVLNVVEDLSSWSPIRAEHSAIDPKSAGTYSVHVRDDVITSTTQEGSDVSGRWSSAKCGVAHFLPSVYYSMQCEALLHETPGSSLSMSIDVRVRQATGNGSSSSSRVGSSRAGRRSEPLRPAGTACVGRTLSPRAVKAGRLQVRLTSKDFVADTDRGEDPSLCKSEMDFRGGDFKKQFACRYKLGPVKEGIFGKVTIEHVSDSGVVDKVVEFNLTRGGDVSPVPAAVLPFQHTPSSQMKCLTADSAKRPVHEIASSLRITDGENWRSLARHLGFSGKEMSRFASTATPFTQVVSGYQSRGGTADEIIQGMYDVSSQLSCPREKRKRSASVVFRHLPLTPRRSISSPMTVFLGDESDDEALDEVTGRLSRRETLEDSPKGVLPLTSSPFTITPPTTPRKRNSNSWSDSESTLLVRSPVKRMRKSLLFSFDQPEELSRRLCVETPTEGVLWNVSEHATREWKRVGRTLNVPEDQLDNIEHAHTCLRQCAYQTLLKWKDMFPRKFTYGTLYSALCDNGLTAHAQKFCTL